ncbi:hypothetical protein EBU71_02210 [bacterium]|nr:hypothetical protein [Candidatus Elulimicrobium humile]
MNIREIFLELTQKTYPHGTEHGLEPLLPGAVADEWGNYYLKLGHSSTIFTSHLDDFSKKQEKVFHKIQDGKIHSDGTTILGADDKAGVSLMIWMIHHQVPGLYYFFSGEERGSIGSSAVKKNWSHHGYSRMISFDKAGYGSIVSHQSLLRTASDEFCYDLSQKFKERGMDFFTDSRGVHTDSALFLDHVPECTNISVGYFGQHTTSEYQDMDYLQKLSHCVLNIPWDELKTRRKTNTREWMGQYEPCDIVPKEKILELETSEEVKKKKIRKRLNIFGNTQAGLWVDSKKIKKVRTGNTNP